MAIGRPITLTDNVASKIISATATASQTAFTVTGGYRINALTVYRNGVCLVDGSDYTAIDGSIVTLTTGASASDTLEFHIFDDFRVSDAILNNSSNQAIDGDLTINGDLTVTGILTGAQIGINSAGTTVGTAKTLNFIGAGNTFRDNGDGIIDVSIAGGGGGGLGTAINYTDGSTSPFSWIPAEATIGENMTFDATNAGIPTSFVVSVIPTLTVASGVAVTVGSGKSMIIDVLQIGDL
jgi:hypothetical protein